VDLYASSIAFIGDGRLLVADQAGDPYAHVEEAPGPDLTLLDTSILADFPAVPRQVRFLCDPRYRDMHVRMLAEEAGHSDFSGVIGGDVPFYPDPSQRVLALLFYIKGDVSGKAQGICVVRSETLLRLAEEIGEGVVEWDIWGKFTVAPDLDEVPSVDRHTKYSVSGSRFMRVDVNEAKRWAKIRVYDLSHWSRQYPDTELSDGREASGEKRVRCRLTEVVLKLPENVTVWNTRDAAMLRDSIVFFRMGGGFEARGILDIWSFW